MKAKIELLGWRQDWWWRIDYGKVYIVYDAEPTFKTKPGAKRNARLWLKKHLPDVAIEEE